MLCPTFKKTRNTIKRNGFIIALILAITMGVTLASAYSGFPRSDSRPTLPSRSVPEPGATSKATPPAETPTFTSETTSVPEVAPVSETEPETRTAVASWSENHPSKLEHTPPPEAETPSRPETPEMPAATRPAPKIKALIFADHPSQDDLPDGDTSFSNGSMDWLYIYAFWQHVDGLYEERIELCEPGGNPYRTIHTLFTTDPSLAGTEKEVDWSPHPIEIQLVSKVRGGYLVEVHIPFGNGTWSSRLPGTWTARVYLNDNPSPSAEASFLLTN